MKKTLALLQQGFESSSQKTPEFIAFCRVFKSEFSKVLKEWDARMQFSAMDTFAFPVSLKTKKAILITSPFPM